jgi:hypothetical protein
MFFLLFFPRVLHWAEYALRLQRIIERCLTLHWAGYLRPFQGKPVSSVYEDHHHEKKGLRRQLIKSFFFRLEQLDSGLRRNDDSQSSPK